MKANRKTRTKIVETLCNIFLSLPQNCFAKSVQKLACKQYCEGRSSEPRKLQICIFVYCSKEFCQTVCSCDNCPAILLGYNSIFAIVLKTTFTC